MVSRNLRSSPTWVLGIVSFVLASTSFVASTATAEARASTCADAWSVAPIVPMSGNGGVQATAASAASDAWIVATGFSNVGFNFPIPEHWDGATWTVTPLPGGGVQWLYGIAAINPSDAWGVGYAYTGYYSGNYNYHYRVMITHWDGASWSDSPSPGKLGPFNALNGIDAVSADDVWAVGYSKYGSLIEHWDGTSWSVVPSPNKGSAGSGLSAVSFSAPDEGWAVGSWTLPRQTPIGYPVSRPLLLHWDGTRWARVARPHGVKVLSSLVAIAPDDVWAVGSAGSRTVAVHWNGVSWSIVPTPSPGVSATLTSVAGLGTADVWAVGSQEPHRGSALRTLIERWDGSSWREEPSPNVGPKDDALVAVSAVPGLLLAGGYSEGRDAPLALERCLA